MRRFSPWHRTCCSVTQTFDHVSRIYKKFKEYLDYDSAFSPTVSCCLLTYLSALCEVTLQKDFMSGVGQDFLRRATLKTSLLLGAVAFLGFPAPWENVSLVSPTQSVRGRCAKSGTGGCLKLTRAPHEMLPDLSESFVWL